jgi:ABC-type polysaccharide/polyol phosphate transport system ATPase subunit
MAHITLRDVTVDIDGTIGCMTDIGMGMDPEATGAENIVLRGVFMGLTFAEAKALVPRVAEFSELGDYLNMPLRIYSTGMYLRLAFAVSTELRPQILVLDELISAGDARFLDRARARLQEMFSAAKVLALATHDMALAKTMCNRAILLEQGEIQARGTPDEIVAEYLRRIGAAA